MKATLSASRCGRLTLYTSTDDDEEMQEMIVSLAEGASNAMLDALSAQMKGGSIEILSADGRVIAVLSLSTPAALPAVDGQLEFAKIAEGDAIVAGTATTARIVTASGAEVLSCDVGDADSDAVVKLSPVRISAGAPVRLSSFRLSMP